jgi:hypothetical protein
MRVSQMIRSQVSHVDHSHGKEPDSTKSAGPVTPFGIAERFRNSIPGAPSDPQLRSLGAYLVHFAPRTLAEHLSCSLLLLQFVPMRSGSQQCVNVVGCFGDAN